MSEYKVGDKVRWIAQSAYWAGKGLDMEQPFYICMVDSNLPHRVAIKLPDWCRRHHIQELDYWWLVDRWLEPWYGRPVLGDVQDLDEIHYAQRLLDIGAK